MTLTRRSDDRAEDISRLRSWYPAAIRLARRARLFIALICGLALLLPARVALLPLTVSGPTLVGVLFMRMLLWGLRIEVRPTGRLMDRALVVANHISWTDILVLGSMRPAAFVAKAEVRHWPLLGLLARLHGTIFVHRNVRQAARAQIDALTAALGNGPVVLFPEGTTGSGEAVLPFRSTLLAAGSPGGVQPVMIMYRPQDSSWAEGELAAFAWDGDKSFWPHLLAISAGPATEAHVIVLEPLSAELSDRKALAQAAHDCICQARTDFSSV